MSALQTINNIFNCINTSNILEHPIKPLDEQNKLSF